MVELLYYHNQYSAESRFKLITSVDQETKNLWPYIISVFIISMKILVLGLFSSLYQQALVHIQACKVQLEVYHWEQPDISEVWTLRV